jgi:DNA-binding protein YbaB
LNESVRVTIGSDGLVDTLTIDPRALRQGSEALAELTREAVRKAQRDWFVTKTGPEATRESQERLQARLEEIRADYDQRMAEINRAIAGVARNR